MAPDFRKQLYRRYVTSFKTGQVHRDERRIQEYRRWCDFKILPMLEPVDRDSPILELGCGPGYVLEYLGMRGFAKSEGIDISTEQVALCRTRNLRATVADVFRYLPRKRKHFSAILALDFIEHFTKKEILSLMPLIRNALAQDGVLVLQTPNGQGLFPGQVIYGDLTHQTIFAQDSLSHLLTLSGFGDIRFAETGPVPDTVEGKIRTFLWSVIRTVIRLVRQIEAKNSSRLWTESMLCWCRKM